MQQSGCRLEDYAKAKQLPVAFLQSLGLTDTLYCGQDAIRIPYFDPAGQEVAVRFRLALEKGPDQDQRFRWKRGSKLLLYGLPQLLRAKQVGHITIPEGESDCHVLWFHALPACGVPGATNWKEERDAGHFAEIPIIYVVDEGDDGAEQMKTWLSRSQIRDRVRVIVMPVGMKDPSALYLANPAGFLAAWKALMAQARPWTELEAQRQHAASEAAWQCCADLARQPSILECVTETLKVRIVGEAKRAKLLYLVLVTRFFPRPVSMAIKGPSGGGKSYLLEGALALHPPSAALVLSAMSERLLAYTSEPLQHRYLVLFEAAGMEGDMGNYLIRSLLSENCIRYATLEKTSEGIKDRIIERAGPTGLLVTTTKVRLHPENETRLFSLPITDTPEQTKEIFKALAANRHRAPFPNLEQWHALQVWLQGGPHEVAIPYAHTLADLIPATAVRLRRDVGAVLTLIRGHALLHRATRTVTPEGHIVAILEDYGVVRELVEDLISEGVGATVPPAIRETVEAVRALLGSADKDDTVTIAQVAAQLKLDKSAVSRRVRVAVEAGYLQNKEARKGRPAQLVLGDAMPDESTILPTVEVLTQVLGDRCTVAVNSQGEHSTPSPADLAGCAAAWEGDSGGQDGIIDLDVD